MPVRSLLVLAILCGHVGPAHAAEIQILTTPGVELVGPLPPELQSYVVFAAGMGVKAKQPAAARQLIEFLAGPVAIPVIKAQGMQTPRANGRDRE